MRTLKDREDSSKMKCCRMWNFSKIKLSPGTEVPHNLEFSICDHLKSIMGNLSRNFYLSPIHFNVRIYSQSEFTRLDQVRENREGTHCAHRLAAQQLLHFLNYVLGAE